MKNLRLGRLLLAGCATSMLFGTAHSGGFDRGGINIDLLFDPSDVAAEAAATYVAPQRTIYDIRRGPLFLPDPPGGAVPGLYTERLEVEGDYWVPRAAFKMNVVDPVDCVGTYSEPYGADQYHGANNAYSPSAVKFSIDTNDYGLTCSYKMQLGRGVARVIAGASYMEVDAFLSRQTLLQFGNPGVGFFELSDDTWGWRLGGSYEIPELAFRASLVYSSKYDVDMTGIVDTRPFGDTIGTLPPFDKIPAYTGVFPITASTEIPQAVELRMQTGIAPGWVAFGAVKWQEWSKLQIIAINGVYSPLPDLETGKPRFADVSFDALYRDGWTVTGGVGHKFNDSFSGAASITWDRGTKTIIGTQTDTWTFSVGGSYAPTPNVELRLGGIVGWMAGGTSLPSNADSANDVTYTFDDDIVLAGTGSLRIKF